MLYELSLPLKHFYGSRINWRRYVDCRISNVKRKITSYTRNLHLYAQVYFIKVNKML